jgi:hypothetical protein
MSTFGRLIVGAPALFYVMLPNHPAESYGVNY